jgi:FG-GAP-like repeat
MKRLTLALFFIVALPLAAQLIPGPAGADSKWPLVGDINGDGLDDVIDGNTVQFSAGGELLPPVSLGISGTVLDVLHLTGGHAADLLVTASDDIYGPYSLWINDGHGHFTSVPVPTVGPLGVNNAFLAPYIADFDGDGKDDLVLFNPSGPGVQAFEFRFLRSRGDGTFEEVGSSTGNMTPLFSSNQMRRHLATGDLNGDGHPDLVFRGQDMVTFLFGHGDGTFEPPVTRFLPMHGFGTVDGFHIADVDGDGNADLVWPDQRAVLHVFFGDGHGNFGRMASITMGEGVGKWDDVPRTLALLHYSDNKRFDVAVGAPPGLVVILTYANGALHEVSRVQLVVDPPPAFPGDDANLNMNVFLGRFRAGAPPDLYAFESGGWQPQSARLLLVSRPALQTLQAAAPRARILGRGISGPVKKDTVSLHVVTTGCPVIGEQTWQLQRLGVFAAGTADNRLVETVTDDHTGEIYFRGTGGSVEFLGTLSLAADGHYLGTWDVSYACSGASPTLDAYVVSNAH